MKYKQKPEYFIVEELAEHNVVNDGPYKLYDLTKEGVETFDLLAEISKQDRIPYPEIGIAGIKDKHAITSQYISVPKKYTIKNKHTKFLGFINNPIRLGNLEGNKFKIIVTELTKDELNDMYIHAENISEGILNYFDSQRFGSVYDNVFIAKYLVKKDYESAVKVYLTGYREFEEEKIKQDKENILKNWGTFDCQINTYSLKRIVDKYKEKKNWIITFKQINKSLRAMFISAYQSYIWNECIKELIKNKNTYEVPYAIGNLIFLNESIDLPENFSTISHRLIPSFDEKQIIEDVLKREDVQISDFNISKSGNFFKSNKRPILVKPKNFKITEPQKNEFGYSVKIEFSLPKGSYATIVLKKLFGK